MQRSRSAVVNRELIVVECTIQRYRTEVRVVGRAGRHVAAGDQVSQTPNIDFRFDDGDNVFRQCERVEGKFLASRVDIRSRTQIQPTSSGIDAHRAGQSHTGCRT